MKKLTAAAISMVLLALVVPGTSQANPYVSGGTAVYRENGQTRVDDGATVCFTATNSGIGGACLPFGTPNGAVGVVDAVSGTEVAFQVCIDNNGDGVCTDRGQKPNGEGCQDQVYFSHGDDGLFHNPLGPLPTSRAPGCATTGGWNGYIVFVCEGVHTVPNGTASGGQPHVHPATTGTISNAPAGTGYGNFCGASRETVVEKDYRVI
jgi:hypothetical protein